MIRNRVNAVLVTAFTDGHPVRSTVVINGVESVIHGVDGLRDMVYACEQTIRQIEETKRG